MKQIKYVIGVFLLLIISVVLVVGINFMINMISTKVVAVPAEAALLAVNANDEDSFTVTNTENTNVAIDTGNIKDTETTSPVVQSEPSDTQGETKNLPSDTTDGETQEENNTVNPPIPKQGGTCITGKIIDHYHQDIGNGWEVIATHTDGTAKSVKADVDGHYRFTGLKAGTWNVSITAPTNWQYITAQSFEVTLTGEGTQCAEVRHKLLRPACLDVKKVDANGNMGFDQAIGIPDWEITVTDGNMTFKGKTDGLGEYRFYDLPPGRWTVTEERRVGWVPTIGYPEKQVILLESPHVAGVCESLLFVNEQIHEGCITVCKVDSNNKPLSNWEIRLTRIDGTQPSATHYTNELGCTRFTDLPLGEWRLEEKVKDWWRPVGDDAYTVNLTTPGTCDEITFKNEPLGCVDGYKINHLDQGLSGWTIKARNNLTGEEVETVTDNTGYFKFKGLPLGTWTISEQAQPGWTAVTASEFEVTLTEPFVCEHVRFKNRTDYACVDIYKIDDFDSSGIPDWPIIVQPAYGGTPLTGKTDGIGHIRFNQLTPGIYDISEKVLPGWVAVSPTTQRRTLEANGSCQVITFINRQSNMPSNNNGKPPDTLPKTGDDLSTTCQTTYIVKRGDTLYSIARQHGITHATLKQVNQLSSNTISVGQQLCIP